ncbi:cytidine deaminase [Kitasatospora sp. MAA4]|uniref:hypothetical protein n=1 Tax=Kitasatospora sp. MAA4 TaxID=3035093 RepID=UPI002474D301|nr:hypothetical protein [Kitasatospora sp. MAA4]MDH6132428.1 cytidine deaminase [Kitasatospora sp. MAA4]
MTSPLTKSPEFEMNPAHLCTEFEARRLVSVAFDLIRQRYVVERHQIASAILAADGRIIVGLHSEAMVGRFSVCAETAALSSAILCGASPVAIAAVRYPKPSEEGPARIVAPCGACRELLLDYAPDIGVVIQRGDSAGLIPVSQEFPDKYRGTKWGVAPDPYAWSAP